MVVKMVCRTCGSDRVLRDAWAEWDVAFQTWVLQNVFDEAYCEGSCDGPTSIDEVEIPTHSELVNHLKQGD